MLSIIWVEIHVEDSKKWKAEICTKFHFFSGNNQDLVKNRIAETYH